MVIMIFNKTVNKVITNELNKYLDIGTPVVPDRANKSLKFFIVGFLTNILGGNANNSSIGLNA